MTCSEAKKISLVSILDQIGAKKIKQNNREIWYLSPFRNEATASFKIDLSKNIWFDHGEGKGGNVLDFVMRYYQCDLKEALKVLNNESFSFHQPTSYSTAIEKENSYEVINICSVQNKLLLQYAKQRALNITLLHKYCKEIYYKMDNRLYFALGFKNVLGGYEVRNKYFKGCLGKKSFTTIKNGCNRVILFEGWIDFLSLIILYPTVEYKCDFIILNSTSLKEKIMNLNQIYTKVYLCFDNDLTGDITTVFFQEFFRSKAKDIRYLFKGYKDVNQWLVSKMTYGN